MSQQFFKETIKPEIKELQEEENIKSEGLAFQKWLVNLFCKYNQSIDKDDAIELTTRDGGVDIMLFSPSQQHIYVIQAKFQGVKKHTERNDILGFIKLREQIDYEWVQNGNLSARAKDAFEEYIRCMKDGWQDTWRFVTTGQIPPDIEKDEKLNAECEIYGTTQIKSIYTEAETQGESIPDSVTFSIANGKYIKFDKPRETLVAVVKGNELINLYKKYKERLLAYNVRKFLGDYSINKDIIKTARFQEKQGEQGKNFFYFNNGISAICNSFTIDENSNRVTAEKFQIINGGQTIGSLYKAGNNDTVQVLLKLSKGEDVSTEKGFNREVIKYNNTQNSIKVSDFRANDGIQNHIQKRFENLKVKGSALDKMIEYHPKRSGLRAKLGKKLLKLEELGKIRYVYKYEPCTPIEKAKSLWEIEKEYEKAFGEPDSIWTDEEFNEAVLAITFYDYIQRRIKTIKDKQKGKKQDESIVHLVRLRYHILALARVYVEHCDVPLKIWKKKEDFEKTFNAFWESQIPSINVLIDESKEQNAARGTLSNIIRNLTRWKKLEESFQRQLSYNDI